MDTESLATQAEITWIRTRGWLRLAIRGFGLALVLLAVFNHFAPILTEHVAFAPYRAPVAETLNLRTPKTADYLLLGVGLVVAWWG